MKLSPRTIRDLAQMICGSHGTANKYQWSNFIYRSSSELTEFFVYSCELDHRHDGSTRDSWVIGVLTELNESHITNPSLPSDKIIRVIIELLTSVAELQPDKHLDAVKNVSNSLKHSKLEIKFEQGKYKFFILDTDKASIFTFEKDDIKSELESDLFCQQFPAGLPFGIAKPDFKIFSEKGIQKLQFELKSGMGILIKDVYPNFNFRKLEIAFGVNEFTNTALKKALVNMNQTQFEKDFLIKYAKTFNMAISDIPALVPQAWIQWHSRPKKDLRSSGSKHSDELYRIDFVAFWDNQRYAILIDDIGHYGRKNNNIWQAEEENYSKRLKEDRKLRKEGWQVFRISNWEIRNEDLMTEILYDLKDFVSF